jgi:lysozyme
MRPINQAGLALIISFESFSAGPYLDEGGVWTIGYGHTQDVTKDSPAITQGEGEELLRQDLTVAENSVEKLVKVTLSDNQYAALVSLVYNAGSAPLVRMLGAKLNRGDYAGAADEFLRWRIVDGLVSDGLVRRRNAERALFLAADGEAVSV